MTHSPHQRPVPADAYTHEYFELSHGHDDFVQSRGAVVAERLRKPLDLAEIQPDMRVLDVGCGRGEVLVQCGLRGARVHAFDYASTSIDLSTQALAGRPFRDKVLLHYGNARRLPYPDNSFDRAFMLDIVEHLQAYELHEALVEVRRVLRPGGRLIVHTMPNTWYYRFGYPWYRLIQRLRGRDLPANPRDRWGGTYQWVHVNEQNVISLTHALQSAGFRPKVWLWSPEAYEHEANRIARFVMRFLVEVYPFRWFFCNDILAVVTKSSA